MLSAGNDPQANIPPDCLKTVGERAGVIEQRGEIADKQIAPVRQIGVQRLSGPKSDCGA